MAANPMVQKIIGLYEPVGSAKWNGQAFYKQEKWCP